jgi:hypothetical protein
MRDTWSTGLYFGVYHHCKRTLPLAGTPKELTAGGIAGMVAWGSCLPFDVVKVSERAGGAEQGRSGAARRSGAAGRTTQQPPSLALASLARQHPPSNILLCSLVKTRVQSAPPDMPTPKFLPTFMELYRARGLPALFAGATPMLSRAFVVNGLTFWAYEETMRAIR